MLVFDRYYIKTDKASGIVHDPNKWFDETGDNIVSMIKRITHTSIQTARIIDTLPTPSTDGWTPNHLIELFKQVQITPNDRNPAHRKINPGARIGTSSITESPTTLPNFLNFIKK